MSPLRNAPRVSAMRVILGRRLPGRVSQGARQCVELDAMRTALGDKEYGPARGAHDGPGDCGARGKAERSFLGTAPLADFESRHRPSAPNTVRLLSCCLERSLALLLHAFRAYRYRSLRRALFTIVVNPCNVSAYEGDAPAENATDAQRRIAGGPLYERSAVAALLASKFLEPWSEDCVRHLRDLEFETADAIDLLRTALETGRFLGAEWCRAPKGGPWAACDAYVVTRSEWIQHAHKNMLITYYLKFAISKAGRLILLVRCHTSRG